ncbi:MAG: RDD family protein [Acidobacteriota bacterium]
MAVPPSAVPLAVFKADLGKRIIAALIDAIPAILVGFVLGMIPFIGGIIGGLLAGGWWLVRDGLDLDFADKRSPGKKIMKLRPIRLDGMPMTMDVSIKRNLPLAAYCVGYLLWVVPVLGHLVSIPIFLIGGMIGLIEAVLVLTDAEGRRWGDKMAGTKVVEVAE